MTAGAAVAEFNPNMRFSVGGDYYHAWMEGKGQTNVSGNSLPYHKILPRSFGGGTLYLGARLLENLGLEVGGSVSARKTKIFNLENSTAFTTTKMRRVTSYLDFVGIFPINDCIDFNGSLGIGFFKPKIDSTFTPAAVGGIAQSNQGVSFTTRGKFIFRAGIGSSYQLTDIVGLRAKLGWEGTSSARSKVNNMGSAKIFKDTLAMSLGIFARF